MADSVNTLVCVLKMGGSADTDQITSALGFGFDEWITQTNFPLTEVPSWEDEIEFVDPGDGKFSKDDVLEIFQKRGLKRPTYEHCLRFAQQFLGGELIFKGKSSVVFLHQEWRDPEGNLAVMYFDGCESQLELGLYYPDHHGFHDYWLIAGVRPHK